MILDGKSLQEHLFNVGVSQGILHFSYYTFITFLMMLSVILLSALMTLHSTPKLIRLLLYIHNLPDDAIRNTVVCPNDTTLYSEIDKTSAINS